MSERFKRSSVVRFGLYYISKCLILLCCLHASALYAGPWVSPGDEQTRHHIQVLSDSGRLKSPIATWPLMWSAVSQVLDQLQVSDLNDTELWSYHYLKHKLNQAEQGVSVEVVGISSGDQRAISSFASDTREENEVVAALTGTGNFFSFKLQGSYVDDPLDGETYRIDGSYGVLSLGNWTVGGGAIDRWWGPGWQHSLILSNSARPAPGVFVKRNENRPFSFPVLRWLGPWDVDLFASKLEEGRHVPNAKLLGARVNIKPFRFFEVGVSRTAQWGGEGRPQDWSSLVNLALGRDNRGEGNIAEDGSNEPGNQLAGYDWRFNFNAIGASWALYQQRIGEDEQNYLPFQSIDLWGMEVSFVAAGVNSRLAIESTDTATHALRSEGRGNVIYEHGIYRDGYRHYGRPLGASIDNDARMVSLNAFHEFDSGVTLTWAFAAVELNRDNSPTRSPYTAPIEVETTYAEFDIKIPVASNLRVGFGATYIGESFEYEGEEMDSSVSAAIELRL